MRKIIGILHSIPMTKLDTGEPYRLYTYQLDDGSEIETPQQFTVNDMVEVWFDEKWNKAKMRKRNVATNDK